MPRRREVPRRDATPDPKFGDRQVAKFINVLMQRGKKSIAESIAYGALQLVEERAQEEPVRLFRRALDNVRPRVEVKSRRVGGATYQVPVEVTPTRGSALAMRWVVQYARARAGKSMREKLAAELLDAAAERGEAVRKREETHRMADANRAFAHYRW
ncbi:MAG TPA: 30S ribosomal protein S7 [Myxococcota bacterium]|jgi:small subunit ribosomal protein S7|nr:30S ribosomal protein S7 [Myxococcota bacterium]